MFESIQFSPGGLAAHHKEVHDTIRCYHVLAAGAQPQEHGGAAGPAGAANAAGSDGAAGAAGAAGVAGAAGAAGADETSQADSEKAAAAAAAEASDAEYNRVRLALPGRVTSEICTSSFNQATCKIIPGVASAMVNGLDLYYYECLVCNKYYSTPRDCTYKEFRFVTRAELADHISKFHPTKTNNKAVKLHGDQCLKARWHGLGPKNDYILNSGPFDYKAQTASVVPGSNVEQQEAVEAVKAEKKRQNSFRISKLDKHIFLAAHPGLNALAESAAEVVRQTIVREHGGGKEGVSVCVCVCVCVWVCVCVQRAHRARVQSASLFVCVCVCFARFPPLTISL